MLLSHVDLRVRDRAKAAEFYDALLAPLGAVKEVGATFTTWQIGEDDEWLGITEDRQMTPNVNRIALRAPSRGTIDAIATYLATIGAGEIEMPHEAYGPEYYACFFTDPDGNRLEICALG